MKRTKLKNPNTDYPLLGYRVKKDIKLKLQSSIEELTKKFNKSVGKDEKKVKKNEVFIMALEKGLKALEKRKL